MFQLFYWDYFTTIYWPQYLLIGSIALPSSLTASDVFPSFVCQWTRSLSFDATSIFELMLSSTSSVLKFSTPLPFDTFDLNNEPAWWGGEDLNTRFLWWWWCLCLILLFNVLLLLEGGCSGSFLRVALANFAAAIIQKKKPR